MSRLSASSLLAISVLSLVAVFASGCASAAGSKEPAPSASNNRLRELMTQRYEILQRVTKNEERMLEAGRVDVPTFQRLTVAMYHAEADLCTTAADRLKVYEKLVDVLTTHEKWLERQAASGRYPEVQVDEGRLVTLNARIDLERLRLGQPASQ
jgi:hypothetical protein